MCLSVIISGLFLNVLFRKRYETMKKSTGTIQRWVRGFLARRQARSMRRGKAATIIQAAYRGHVQVGFKCVAMSSLAYYLHLKKYA